MHVLLLFAAEVAVAVGRDGLGRLDDFNVEAGAKGGQVGDGEVVGTRIPVGWEVFRELAQAERGEDGDDVGVVGEVKVEALVERESLGVVVQCDVDLRA